MTISEIAFRVPGKHEEVTALYRPRVLVGMYLFLLGLTAAPWLVAAVYHPTSAAFPQLRSTTPSPAIVWLAALVQLPLYFLARRALRARSPASFRAAYWLHSVLQIVWAVLFSFYCVPHYAILGLVVFLGLLAGWSFVDGSTWLGSWEVKLLYATGFASADLSLLLADWWGEGLVAAYRVDPGYVVEHLIAQALCLGMALIVLSVMARPRDGSTRPGSRDSASRSS